MRQDGSVTGLEVELHELRFLYIGVDDTSSALAQWLAAGATLRWRFQHFGADVAGLEVGDGPLVLWSVSDLGGAMATLVGAGWQLEGPLGTPEGDAAVATSGDGTELALLEVTRPDAMDGAYADEGNTHRVR